MVAVLWLLEWLTPSKEYLFPCIHGVPGVVDGSCVVVAGVVDTVEGVYTSTTFDSSPRFPELNKYITIILSYYQPVEPKAKSE